jgi:hypothetical protein
MRQAGLTIVGVAALFVCFFLGAFYANLAREPEHEMGPELAARAAAMFVDFQNKRVTERITLNIVGDCATEVAVVDRFDIGVAGFVRTSSPVHQFYLIGEGIKVYRFNNEYLFVIIKEWYRSQLKRERGREKG